MKTFQNVLAMNKWRGLGDSVRTNPSGLIKSSD